MKINNMLAAAFAALSLSVPGAASAINVKPFVVPEVREWKGGVGTFVVTPGSTRICYTDTLLRPVAETMASDYAALTGNTLAVVRAKGGKGDIILATKPDRRLGGEGYTIGISDRVTVSAPALDGLRWGAATILQLCDGRSGLPVGTITDYPDYSVRGLMIDAGRKYIPMDYLYKLVDVLAYRKMNTLHVHLNDNGFKEYFNNDWNKTQAAFRLECDTYPGLTARDGSYTKQEFRQFQKYAASRGVEIIPEIDFPAHALAFTRYMPEIACDGVHNDVDHLDLKNPKTYGFIDALLREYLEGPDPVFAGGRFHIGTDEYQGDSIDMENFRALTARYIDYTKQFGKRPVVWGSLSHAKGSTPVPSEGVDMYLWSNDYSKPLQMMELGYQTISVPDWYVYLVPGAGYYYDYLDTGFLYNEWTPALFNGLQLEEKHPQLSGGMFAVWNDHPNNGITVKDIYHRIMHALPAMAAKTWDGSNVTVPFDEFDAKSSAMSEAPGINYLSRRGNGNETVFRAEVLEPGMDIPIDDIGYNYTVEFDIEGADEPKGTVLFSNPDATVWLSDPITGNLGYSRENKLVSYRHDIRGGEKAHIRITGDNQGTKLYVNGKLADNKNISWAAYGIREKAVKRFMADIKTLVFPLKQAGQFNSRITNLQVKNYID